MHQLGTLQLGSHSPIFSVMQSYPPGLPLLEFYFTAFSRDFSEGALYVGYTCGTMAFFLPAFSNWNRKDWRLLAPCGLLILSAPFVFTSHYGDAGLFGMSLFVDPLLGVTAGSAFYLASQNPFRNRFEAVRFSMTLMAMSLLKSTGIVFALFALACAFFLKPVKSIYSYFLPAAALLAGIGTWKLLLSLYGVHELVPLRLHFLDQEELTNLLHAMVSINVIGYKLPLGPLLSFLPVYTVLWICFAVAPGFRRKQNKKAEITVSVFMIASALAFVYGYAAIYARTLESFPRYMATPLLCLATYLLLREIPLCTSGKLAVWAERLRAGIWKGAAGLCIVIAVSVIILWQALFAPYADAPHADADARKIQEAVLADHPRTPARIYLVMAGDGVQNSRYHHRIFFYLLSDQMNLCNRIFESRAVEPDAENPEILWARELQNGFDYVYVHSVEEPFASVFLSFSDTPPRPGTLYRIVSADNVHGIKLVPTPE